MNKPLKFATDFKISQIGKNWSQSGHNGPL